MSHTPTRHRAASGITVAAALLSTLVAPAQALADGCGGANKGLDCNLSGVTGGRGGGGGGGTGGGGTGGVSGPVAPPAPEGLTDNQAVDGVDGPGGGAPPPPAPPDTWTLVQQARASAQFPVPTVHTAPKGKTFVRLRTSLWVDGFTVVQTQPITVGAQTVQATANPSSVTWNLGETQIVCQDAGSKDGKTCGYTYTRASAGQPGGAWQITATITWKITWTCQGADCDAAGGALDDQTMTSQPTPLVVSEIQTNTGD
ncbi:hypothetical protein [Actinomadura citrea]|uniref:Uncharacterized protein n=1 Tax=Actinomadura citrea TaxID=46158 RepID=A0A7Y9G7S7_9ACTN|nr:hypothetical protein [Actinomadura citrea]NYE11535.1 hypothetical protein [Actinomadura citrea]GGT87595.1 hypothetical protein GCM10010177_53730 [Actinomadura citrea]